MSSGFKCCLSTLTGAAEFFEIFLTRFFYNKYS